MAVTKWGKDIKVGDVIRFLGRNHLITALEPYSHWSVTGGETWAIAHEGPHWAITIDPRASYDVVTLGG